MVDQNESKKRIIVAEDDLFYAKVYKYQLIKAGFEVFMAKNGDEALKLARESKPDLIILDLIMPVKNGFDTLKELKVDSELSAVPVIAVTNLGQEGDIKEVQALGVDDYFVKSNLSVTEMVEKVKARLL